LFSVRNMFFSARERRQPLPLVLLKSPKTRRPTVKSFSTILVGAALGASMLALSSLSASAAIACSGNVCWHTHERLDYPPKAHVTIHEDNWRWGPEDHYAFREHEGRGYWSGGV
jgi:hypothetical protein